MADEDKRTNETALGIVLEPQDPHGVRFGPRCHWCISVGLMTGSTGLRHDLSARLRQVLTRGRPQWEMPGPKRATESIVTRMGVQVNWPLKLWWVTAERYHPELLDSLPPYDELACPRCAGTGRRKTIHGPRSLDLVAG